MPRYVDRDVVYGNMIERDTSIRAWAKANGFEPYQVYCVLEGKASFELAQRVAKKLADGGFLEELPDCFGIGNRYLSPRQASIILGVSIQTIRRWIKEGVNDFPFVKIGTITRIDKGELIKWIDSKKGEKNGNSSK